jgi:HEAT repeat protein
MDLLKSLQDPNPRVRAEAAFLCNDRRAVEPLIAALQDESAVVRYYAALSLGRLGDKRAEVPLIATLRDRDQCVRECAGHALRFICGGRRAYELVMEARAELLRAGQTK